MVTLATDPLLAPLGAHPVAAMAVLLSLDTPSMLVMSIVATAAMALAMAVMRPQRGEGIGLWALALVAYALTSASVLARGQIPPTLSFLLSNTFVSMTLALLLCAIAEFHARPLPRLPAVVPVAAAAALTVAYPDSYPTRLIVTSALWAAQLALVLWALWRPRAPQQPRGALLMSAALGFQCVLLLARAAWSVGHPPPSDFLHGDTVGKLALMSSHAVLVLASLGFVLLTKDRADAINRHLGSNDALTGIANRRLLLQTLARDVARAVRQRESYAVLMVDIDHFKAVNDRLGHLGGDAVLCHVARLLQGHLRTQDLAGRWGGEEFLLLLPNTSATGAQIVAEKLRQLVERTPCAHQGQSIPVTISVGRCTEELEPGDAPEHLIETADQALYAAKRAGRNRVESAPLARMHKLHGARAAPPRAA